MSQRNKKIVITACILVVLGVLVGLYSSNQKTENAQGVSVGAILPLSGFAANYGDFSLKGLELGQKDFQEKVTIELIPEDSFYSPKGAVDAYHSLRQRGVDVIVVGGSQMANALKPLAEQDGVLLMAIWTAAPSYTDTHTTNYRTSLLPGDFVEVLLGHLGHNDIFRLGVLYAQNDFGLAYRDAFHEHISTNNVSIVAEESFITEETDFRTVLTKLKSSKPESVFFVGTVSQLATVLRQADELALDTQFISTTIAEDPILLSTVEDEAEGLVYAYPFDSTNSYAEDFVHDFQNLYEQLPNQYAAEAYVAVQLISGAVDACTDERIECWKNYLDTLGTIQTVLGEAHFNERGDLKTKEVFLKTVQNGAFIRYTE